MTLIQRCERRRQEIDEDLKFAETYPGVAQYQVTASGGIDATAEHKRHLRIARDEY